jgi:hypothetical protein
MITMHLGRGGRGRASLRMLAAAAVLAATAAVAPAAHAGTYPMYAGDVPGINLPAPSQGAWTFWNTSGGIQAYNELATKTQGASALWQINYPTGVLVQGTGVGLELTIPSTGAKSAVSIASVTDWTETALTPQRVSGPAGPAGGIEAPAVGLNLAPGISNAPGGTASGWNGFTTSGPGHDSGALPIGTQTWRLGVRCAAIGADHNHCTLPSPFLRIRGLKTTLKESVQPSGSITGGTLAGGGILTDTKTIAYSAADAESGVEKVEALLDDVVVATGSNARDLTQPVAQQNGACKYSGLQACPASLDNVLSVDTNQVPDGAYELGLRITDAAGNVQTVLAADPVVIDNHPAPINTELPAIVGAAAQGQVMTAYDGIWRNAVGAAVYRWKRCSADLSSCAPIPDAVAASYRVQALDVGKRLQLEVTRKNDVGEPVAATTSATDVVVAAADQTPVINTPVPPPADGHDGANGTDGRPGPNGQTIVLHLNGHNATASASLSATFSASGRGTVRSAYGKKVLITGRLLTPGGQPITGAKVQVLQQDKLVGARMVAAGEVTTDIAGKFRYVTTAVRSRTIRFAYRTHLEDTAFASTTDISLGVIARLSLSASPRSLRNGGVVVFRGSVAGAPAKARKVIELQVRKGSRWMTFRSTRLRSGRYSERYRFTRTRGRVTYVFRARVREEAGFPFLTSHSRAVKVTVRG